MKSPAKQDWIRIASEFEGRWNFLNCVGAVDGKHVMIKSPAKSGSMFFNYKGHFSIVLLAVVDANYRFIVIDVGGYGKQSDGGTFATSQFGIRLTDGRLDLPNDKAPPECPNLLPYVFVADEAFPLMRNIMRPYHGKKIGVRERVYNYRLSRARRVVENAFGILAARFRVFHRTMDQRPDTVDRIVKATCVLHNMLQKDNVTPAPDLQEDVDDDSLAAGLLPLQPTRGYRASHEAFNIRNNFRDYFSSPSGSVPWQTNIQTDS